VVITIFRSRVRSDAGGEYARWAARMLELASATPGFVSIKTFTADDDERVSIIEFDSEAAHGAWRDHPEHREAQRLGRERLYSEFHLVVCKPLRRVDFPPSHASAPRD
jgi:heme-degrading monooxygenase HmoA